MVTGATDSIRPDELEASRLKPGLPLTTTLMSPDEAARFHGAAGVPSTSMLPLAVCRLSGPWTPVTRTSPEPVPMPVRPVPAPFADHVAAPAARLHAGAAAGHVDVSRARRGTHGAAHGPDPQFAGSARSVHVALYPCQKLDPPSRFGSAAACRAAPSLDS